MKAIQAFLIKLGTHYKYDKLSDAHSEQATNEVNSSVRFVTSKEHQGHKQLCQVIINRHDYIREALIPFLDSLDWQTKKKKDFEDWTSILMLKDKGLQYTDEGLKLIELIISQMNNRRLSSSELAIVDREFLYKEINFMLSKPSNMEVKNGASLHMNNFTK